MKGYWITFTDGSAGYCEGGTPYDAVRIAEHLTGKVAQVDSKWNPTLPSLPYPADPVIWQLDHPVVGKCPTFCMSPAECAGHTSCPRRHSCTE